MIKRTYFMSARKHITEIEYQGYCTQYAVRSWLANSTHAFNVGIGYCMQKFKDVEGDNIEIICFTRT